MPTRTDQQRAACRPWIEKKRAKGLGSIIPIPIVLNAGIIRDDGMQTEGHGVRK